MRKQKQAAIEAIARHFSATWEMGENPPDAYLMLARQRIALEVATIKPRLRRGVSKPRLRFDRVALGFVRRLQAALSEAVPEGKTVIVTITAPIWQPSKTASALEDIIRQPSRAPVRGAGAPGEGQVQDPWKSDPGSPCKGGSRRASKVIGFVHNPDPDLGASLGHDAVADRGHRRQIRQGWAGKIRGAIDGSFSLAKTCLRPSRPIGRFIPSSPSRPTSRRS